MAEVVDIRFLQCKAIDLEENVSKYKLNEWRCALKYEKGHKEKLKEDPRGNIQDVKVGLAKWLSG